MAAPDTVPNTSAPSSESHWYTPESESTQPPHELTISTARAVQEAVCLLGRDATPEQVREHLGRMGIDVSVDFIEQVKSQMKQPCEGRHKETGLAELAANASELVKTEAEPVPP